MDSMTSQTGKYFESNEIERNFKDNDFDNKKAIEHYVKTG